MNFDFRVQRQQCGQQIEIRRVAKERVLQRRRVALNDRRIRSRRLGDDAVEHVAETLDDLLEVGRAADGDFLAVHRDGIDARVFKKRLPVVVNFPDGKLVGDLLA